MIESSRADLPYECHVMSHVCTEEMQQQASIALVGAVPACVVSFMHKWYTSSI